MTNETQPLPLDRPPLAAVHYLSPEAWRTACLIDTLFPRSLANLRRTQDSSKVTCVRCQEAMLGVSPAPAAEYVIPTNVHEHDSVPLSPHKNVWQCSPERQARFAPFAERVRDYREANHPCGLLAGKQAIVDEDHAEALAMDRGPLEPAGFFVAMRAFAALQRQRTEVVALEEASLAVLRDAALELSRAVATRERLDASIKEILASS
jgi:hypothetical protein